MLGFASDGRWSLSVEKNPHSMLLKYQESIASMVGICQTKYDMNEFVVFVVMTALEVPVSAFGSSIDQGYDHLA